LLSGDRILAHRQEAMTKGQAERLMPLIAAVLDDGGANLGQLDAIGVGTGPGNFTGLRISVSAARGLALSLGIPAVGVTGFDALTSDLASDQPALVLIPAPRNAAYVQLRGLPDHATTPGLVQQADPLPGFPADISPMLVTPRDAVLPDRDWSGFTTRIDGAALAPAIARIAARRYQWPDLPRPAPLYLRAADAAPARDTGPVLLP